MFLQRKVQFLHRCIKTTKFQAILPQFYRKDKIFVDHRRPAEDTKGLYKLNYRLHINSKNACLPFTYNK